MKECTQVKSLTHPLCEEWTESSSLFVTPFSESEEGDSPESCQQQLMIIVMTLHHNYFKYENQYYNQQQLHFNYEKVCSVSPDGSPGQQEPLPGQKIPIASIHLHTNTLNYYK